MKKWMAVRLFDTLLSATLICKWWSRKVIRLFNALLIFDTLEYLLHPNVLRCDDPYWFPFRFRFHPNLQGVRLGQKSYQYWFWKCRMVVLELRHYTTCAQRARFCRVYYIIALSGTARWKISRAWETMKNPLFFRNFYSTRSFSSSSFFTRMTSDSVDMNFESLA